jgi:hypothetical protein
MIDNTDRNLFWDVIDDLLTLAMIIGVIATLCFLLGYFWYAP